MAQQAARKSFPNFENFENKFENSNIWERALWRKRRPSCLIKWLSIDHKGLSLIESLLLKKKRLKSFAFQVYFCDLYLTFSLTIISFSVFTICCFFFYIFTFPSRDISRIKSNFRFRGPPQQGRLSVRKPAEWDPSNESRSLIKQKESPTIYCQIESQLTWFERSERESACTVRVRRAHCCEQHWTALNSTALKPPFAN